MVGLVTRLHPVWERSPRLIPGRSSIFLFATASSPFPRNSQPPIQEMKLEIESEYSFPFSTKINNGAWGSVVVKALRY
jgi:hypothetical protein